MWNRLTVGSMIRATKQVKVHHSLMWSPLLSIQMKSIYLINKTIWFLFWSNSIQISNISLYFKNVILLTCHVEGKMLLRSFNFLNFYKLAERRLTWFNARYFPIQKCRWLVFWMIQFKKTTICMPSIISIAECHGSLFDFTQLDDQPSITTNFTERVLSWGCNYASSALCLTYKNGYFQILYVHK